MNGTSGARWSTERASAWSEAAGWLRGCNFTPSTASNQLEMLQPETLDLATIDKELGWARDLGMNVIRLYLHDLLYAADPATFFSTIDEILAIADSHQIRVMPVLFDGVWHPAPQLGPQPEPKPCLHNSRWVQSPGSAILYDRDRWPGLRDYVVRTLERFGQDPRVITWDLFNEPDQIDAITIREGSRTHKAAEVTDLVALVFEWARQADPAQPLTVGMWEFGEDGRPADNALNALIIEHSDVISFHSYDRRDKLLAIIEHLRGHDRPLICTEWLARSAGSTIDLLEVFEEHDVGAINWGLVDGRTQTRFPWRSWTEPVGEDEPWFHELLQRDGTPYAEEEAALYRAITGTRPS